MIGDRMNKLWWVSQRVFCLFGGHQYAWWGRHGTPRPDNLGCIICGDDAQRKPLTPSIHHPGDCPHKFAFYPDHPLLDGKPLCPYCVAEIMARPPESAEG